MNSKPTDQLAEEAAKKEILNRDFAQGKPLGHYVKAAIEEAKKPLREERDELSRLYTKAIEFHAAQASEQCTCDHSASDVITDPYCPIHGQLRAAQASEHGVTKAIELLREVQQWHADKESPDYNECDTAKCQWCELADEAIAALSSAAPRKEDAASHASDPWRSWKLTLNRHEHKHCGCLELYEKSRAAQASEPVKDKRDILLQFVSNPDAALNALHQAGWQIIPKPAQASECDHQWTDYGTLKYGDNPTLEIEVCVRCGVQQRKAAQAGEPWPETHELLEELDRLRKQLERQESAYKRGKNEGWNAAREHERKSRAAQANKPLKCPICHSCFDAPAQASEDGTWGIKQEYFDKVYPKQAGKPKPDLRDIVKENPDTPL